MVKSNVWRPDNDERFAGNALAKKHRHAVRHAIEDTERYDRQRGTYLRREAGRIADGGAYGRRVYGSYGPSYVGYAGSGWPRYPRTYGYPRTGYHYPRPYPIQYAPRQYPVQYAPRQYPVHHGGYPRQILPAPAIVPAIAPAPSRMYYADSVRRQNRMDAAAADVFRAQEELRDVQAARQAESAVEMAQMERNERDRREYGRQLMIEGIEVDRERREIQRDIQRDQITIASAERMSRSNSAPLIAPTPLRPPTPRFERSRPGTPFTTGALTPYASRPGTPFGSRPGTPYLPPISPAPSRLALPAPPLSRSVSGSQYGLGSPGRSLRDFRDDETIMDELAEELRQSRMMGGGRRSSLGMRP